MSTEYMGRKAYTKEEHKKIFIDAIFKACGDMDIARAEYYASEEDFYENGYDDPVGDAESNMSYWEE